MKLYFGNSVTTATTLMIVALLGFVAYAALNRDSSHWGIRSLILLVFGLVVCCFAAARDGFDKSVQNVIDGSCDPGIFGLSDIPTVIGYIGALLIVVAAIATPIAKTQTAREVWFFVMAGGAVMKILTVEISRIIILLR